MWADCIVPVERAIFIWVFQIKYLSSSRLARHSTPIIDGMTNPLTSDQNAALLQHRSVNKVLRQLKKQEVGLYNCVCSVLADTAFVKEIAGLYTDLPLVANLRCGLWYAPGSAGTCYFKSTDGHYGNWSFSCTRLNLHTAILAAREGGCLIVDATRRGKTFPVSHSAVPLLGPFLPRACAFVSCAVFTCVHKFIHGCMSHTGCLHKDSAHLGSRAQQGSGEPPQGSMLKEPASRRAGRHRYNSGMG